MQHLALVVDLGAFQARKSPDDLVEMERTPQRWKRRRPNVRAGYARGSQYCRTSGMRLRPLEAFAFIGSLIDFVMSRRTKAALKSRLEDWWLRFDDMSWGNFGRREAEAAVAILDRWAGARLWSWKRWRFSLLVNLICCVLAISIGLAYGFPIFSAGLPLSRYIGDCVVLYPSITFTFSLSISLTRWIASFVGRLCVGNILDAGLFILLLAAHWLLWCYWSGISFIFQIVPVALIATQFNPDLSLDQLVPADLFLRELSPHLAGGWFPVPDFRLFEHTRLNEPGEPYTVYKATMDFIANGPRIAFALVFLASFLFRPMVQRPVGWLWLKVLDSTLPVFTLVFGIAGGMIKFVYSLLS